MSPYERITEIIMDKLSAGVVPWRRPWSCVRAAGVNLSTLKPYRGINALLTSIGGFESPFFATYKQARELGANVRKGEKGTPIVFFTKIEKENADGETERFPMLRTYTVFNASQLDNLKLSHELLYSKRQAVASIDAAEAIVERMPQRPDIAHGGDRAFYRPSEDRVQMPTRDLFSSAEHYYATLYHELSHAVGHQSRLSRKGVTNSVAFGTHEYSAEELVAEMGSAFLCAEAGIDAPVIDNAAAYIASWLKVLSNDARMVVVAAAQAQRTADFILDRRPVGESAQESHSPSAANAA